MHPRTSRKGCPFLHLNVRLHEQVLFIIQHTEQRIKCQSENLIANKFDNFLSTCTKYGENLRKLQQLKIIASDIIIVIVKQVAIVFVFTGKEEIASSQLPTQITLKFI